MSNLQTIAELCRICEAQNHIIKAQAEALAQMDAVVMEAERADTGRALTALTDCGEMLDDGNYAIRKQREEAWAWALAADGRR